MDSETPVPTKPKRVLKQHQLENLRKGREARMKKLEDKKNELNIHEQTVPQSVTTLSDMPEQPIIIEREKPVKPKKQETPVPVQETPVPVQETPEPVQETPETPKSRRKRLARENYKKNKTIKRKTPAVVSETIPPPLTREPSPPRQQVHDRWIQRDAFRLPPRRAGFV